MITIHQCRICGNQSRDKRKIKRCEAKGKKNKFFEGDLVYAQTPGVGGVVVVKVKVRVASFFEKKTHRAFYNLERCGKMPKWMNKIICNVPENKLSRKPNYPRA